MNQFTKIIALFSVIAGSLAAPVADNTNTGPDEIAGLSVPETNSKPVGQATYYEAGLGACGVTSNGATEDIVALPHGLMGAQSNGNPFCGRRVMISYGGKQFPGTVQDKCMGCSGNNIDLSAHLFQKFAPFSAGRLSGVEWHFI